MPIKHTDREPTVFDRIVFSYRNCAILDDLRTTPLHTPAGARYLPEATKAEKIIPGCVNYFTSSFTSAGSTLIPGPIVVEIAIPLR
jgi:hypothetical protein